MIVETVLRERDAYYGGSDMYKTKDRFKHKYKDIPDRFFIISDRWETDQHGDGQGHVVVHEVIIT